MSHAVVSVTAKFQENPKFNLVKYLLLPFNIIAVIVLDSDEASNMRKPFDAVLRLNQPAIEEQDPS